MKFRGRIILFLFCLFPALYGGAQLPAPELPLSNFRAKAVPVQDSLVLDTLSIIPQTFVINGLADSTWRLDFVRAVLYWNHRPPTDTVSLSYRVFPFRLNSVVQRLRYDSIARYSALSSYGPKSGEEAKGLFRFGNLQYNGSFGRGISFGNNQDAVVTSNLNLQLQGMLADSIEIAAAISDNNIPIQPDGNTQQLNEFDQVYLQFRKKGWQLNLGDIDLRQNDLYFLNFYKRLQGLSFQITNKLSPTVQSSTLASGSIAKGKFTRNVFQGLEGNQGPYRLTGANNELFFILLAGTERVFLNGELLQRGEDQDYVVNYNTAEVTFTPRRMITKDSRIQVEFEYADRNYLNANLYLSQTLELNKKLKIKLAAFTNSDAKNSPINQTLDNRQKQFLFDLGDSVQRALYGTAVRDTFATDKILYERVYDTTGAGIDSFYRYSTDPALARYSLSFTDLGDGGGNYVPDFNGANGKVFRYVAPVNGVKGGRFEPVMVLVAPKKQQLLTLGSDYTLNKNNRLQTEVALSNYDVNSFSSKDGGDDAGLAAKLQYENRVPLKGPNALALATRLDLEHVNEKFRPLERLRQVEFSREWGLPLVVSPATENIFRFSTGLQNQAARGLTYGFTTYQRSDSYKGYQNTLQQTAAVKGWNFNNAVALTRFNSATEKGSYLHPSLDISKQLRFLSGLQVGGRYALERSEVRHRANDSIDARSFSFDTYTAYLKTDESRKNRYGLSFFTRADQYPLGDALVKGDRSYNVNLEAQLLQSARHQLLFNATYRKLKVYEKAVSQNNDDQTILGRTEYLVNEWKGLLTGNVLYELGTGQEQKRDFAFLEVPAGQGEFTWNDYNGDGVQQLNEFEVAQFRDQAKFIRIFVPSNEFVKAAYTTFNYSFRLDPAAVIGKGAGRLGRWVSRLYWQTSLQQNKKLIATGDFEFNPFRYNLQDTGLLTLNTSFVNTVSINRMSPKWGLDVSLLQSNGKALLTYGYESRRLEDLTARLRYNFSKSILLNVLAKRGANALFSPAFDNKNYHLEIMAAEPQLVFIKGTVFRLQGSGRLERKVNEQKFGGEEAFSRSLSLETKYNVLQNSSLNAKFTVNSLRFDYPANTTVSYIMLDGLLPGTNLLWAADITRRLLNNVELNFQYEGRRPGETRPIHTGRASLRALF
ncbi:hypothetical protein V9K67_00840 [Paraflavisolibacter sp. H34]|uniref:hypothetical protein n=1 Tax=Huijunlia imazamoxiresistens TaxID=3127457 RepID=UPI003015C042